MGCAARRPRGRHLHRGDRLHIAPGGAALGGAVPGPVAGRAGAQGPVPSGGRAAASATRAGGREGPLAAHRRGLIVKVKCDGRLDAMGACSIGANQRVPPGYSVEVNS